MFFSYFLPMTFVTLKFSYDRVLKWLSGVLVECGCSKRYVAPTAIFSSRSLRYKSVDLGGSVRRIVVSIRSGGKIDGSRR
jgi:hypothetical protein